MTHASEEFTRSPVARLPWGAVAWLLGAGVALFGMLLGLGWLVTHVEPGTAVDDLDVGILRWLVAHRIPALDVLSAYADDIAATRFVLAAGIAVAVVGSVLVRRWWPLGLMAVALVGELVMFLNAAILVGRPRPPVPHLDAALPPTSSFPSGHTAAAICLYGGLAVVVLHATRAWWRHLVMVVAVVLVVAVAAARLYRGAHHPTDVLASVAFAVPWLLATGRFWSPSRPGRRPLHHGRHSGRSTTGSGYGS